MRPESRLHISPCPSVCVHWGGGLTCFEDLVANGEAGSMRLIVRHELDEELVAAGDHRRGGDLTAVLPHQLPALVHAVTHLHVVIPEINTTQHLPVSVCVER